MSDVWTYYEKAGTDKAKCKLCKKQIKSGLYSRSLDNSKSKHPIEFKRLKPNPTSEKKEKSKGNDHYRRIVIPKMAEKTRAGIKEGIGSSFFAITSDGWSNPLRLPHLQS
uniref:BED-type domain-containing protein n=1 Tax=Meloidogyne hapla TaxID=6305 RepID=A0A1I8BPE9_MELHA